MKINRNLIVAVVATMLAIPTLGTINADASMKLTDIPGGQMYGPAVHQHVKYRGHVFIASPNGTITYVDGINNPSDAQIKAAINGKSVKQSSSNSTQDNITSQSSSTSQTNSNNQSNSKPDYQSSNTNHGKLVQTSEHSTARKAGITAVIIALVAFVGFKVRKMMKRN